MSRPSRGTGTSDGALSASDKEDPLYIDIDEARVDYASSKTNADTGDITMMPNVVYEARVDYASSKTDTKDIEMMPNVVYGKHTYK